MYLKNNIVIMYVNMTILENMIHFKTTVFLCT